MPSIISPIVDSLSPETPLSIINPEKINNNTNITIDLSNIVLVTNDIFGPNNWELSQTSPYKIAKVIVNWGDGYENTYNIGIVEENEEWIKNIGPHYYNNNESKEYIIKIKIYDSVSNLYSLDILVDILAQSISDLDIEFEPKKSVYNGELATVIFNITTNQDSTFNKSKIPIISVLT